MNSREIIRQKLLFRKDEMEMPQRDIVKDITQHLTKEDWENIERQLYRAIR